jgi:MOSC domain-containing protein YiiM
VQISQPRQPCFKLGIRFEDLKIIKNFTQDTRCGTYLRIIKSGDVQVGDELELLEKGEDLSVADVFSLLYHSDPHPKLEMALHSKFLPESCLKDLRYKHQ